MLLDGRADVVHVGLGHARVNAEPERVIHEPVGVGQIADLSEPGACLPHFVETGLSHQVAGKEHPRLDACPLEGLYQAVACHRGAGLDHNEKAEPARYRARGRLRQAENVAVSGKSGVEELKVPSTGSDE